MALDISATVALPFAEAVEAARRALANHGFGIITEIDMQQAFREKIGEQSGPYTILGACNPRLAFEATRSEANVGLLLPCNVIVHEVEDGVRVAAVDPEQLLGLIGGADLQQAAAEVRKNLAAAIDELAHDDGAAEE